ncbi:MAG: nucleotide-binding protein, partial [Eggerthellaceae bacterium]|nr:nucleotide-binding protein [Eggerthellaceae bacterium]
KKELSQRYDLKGTGSDISLDKGAGTITITAPGDFVARQIIDIMQSKLFKRGIELAAVKWGNPLNASGGKVRVIGNVVNGIEKDLASSISKDIRGHNPKVKVQIEGDKLRVISASRDTLQDVIAFLKSKDYGQPLQYVNYR